MQVLIRNAALIFASSGAIGGAAAFYFATTTSVTWGIILPWTAAGATAGAMIHRPCLGEGRER